MRNRIKIALLFLGFNVVVGASTAHQVVITVTGKDQISIDAAQTPIAAVPDKLREKKAADSEVTILIIASETGTQSTIIRVMDSCNKAGIVNVRLQMKAEANHSPEPTPVAVH